MRSSAIILHGLCHVMIKAGEGRHSMLSAQTGKTKTAWRVFKGSCEAGKKWNGYIGLKKMSERERESTYEIGGRMKRGIRNKMTEE